MSPTTRAMLESWNFDPLLWFPLLLALVLYFRGWRHLHGRLPTRFPRWRLYCYTSGLWVTWLAIASPLDALGTLLLSVHMTQHLLLMMVGPPLILLGAPGLPMLMGLPRTIRRYWVGPFLAWGAFRRGARFMVHPVVGWTLFFIATWAWHVPVLYEAGLRNPTWHVIEHACFIFTATLFWWPVIQPWPSSPHWPRWAMIPYLLLADLQNTIFSAFFCFKETPLYQSYASAPRITSLDALQDQSLAGAIMWVPGSIIYLVPVAILLRSLLAPRLVNPAKMKLAVAGHASRVSLTVLDAHGQVQESFGGGITERDAALKDHGRRGSLIAHPAFRRSLQSIMILLAVAVILDGLLGPEVSPLNLAGVLPWTHWRGLVVLALLLAGNLFCFACPFMLPRELGKKLFNPTRPWPTWLRSKWIAVGLLLGFLWSYEVLSLWDSPWLTAWIIIGYFFGAIVIDSCFRGASFCKYVCPIGQFHFVQSLASPREVRIRSASVCSTCSTHDCIKGNEQHRGCELDLFQPRKNGNMDCTFCLDCVRACPQDNVGLLPSIPGNSLVHDPNRSSVGRFSTRWDICALVAVLVFGAFANALGMVGPVLETEARWQEQLGLESILPVATATFFTVAVLIPAVLLPLAGLLSKAAGPSRERFKAITIRGTLGLVPIGFAMWLVHMLFHLLTSWLTAWPAAQRVMQDLGVSLFGEPAFAMSCCGPAPNWLLPVEILLLDLGLLLSLYVLYRLARQMVTGVISELRFLLPWAVVAFALYCAGVWIILQPMQMRGTMLP